MSLLRSAAIWRTPLSPHETAATISTATAATRRASFRPRLCTRSYARLQAPNPTTATPPAESRSLVGAEGLEPPTPSL
jgi:hypothetical protein